MFFIGLAYAMGAKGEGSGGGFAPLIPLLLMFVVFYFILIRPQQKQAKKHQDFVKNLKMGDRVVTSGGLHGTVAGLTDTTVTLEIADKVRVKVTRSAIGGSSQEAAAPEGKTG
ncbi:MAG TPA: preprotein translocase subunit YajC [Candidatus Deferrimicrobiaceae bacterium]|nr:preprotein translocase subunit YajC [Candidatus Deferrimicrobiaceae bacterium]